MTLRPLLRPCRSRDIIRERGERGGAYARDVCDERQGLGLDYAVEWGRGELQCFMVM